MGEEASSSCWRKEFNDLFKACWSEGKETRIFKNVRYLYAAGELEGGQEEQQNKQQMWIRQRRASDCSSSNWATTWRNSLIWKNY